MLPSDPISSRQVLLCTLRSVFPRDHINRIIRTEYALTLLSRENTELWNRMCIRQLYNTSFYATYYTASNNVCQCKKITIDRIQTYDGITSQNYEKYCVKCLKNIDIPIFFRHSAFVYPYKYLVM